MTIPGTIKSLALIGMMGAGKSTVAQRVGEKTGWPWNDLDDLIAGKTGQSIADIFSQKGEEYFRELESRVFAEAVLAAPCPHIMATGGGTPIHPHNAKILQRHYFVLWLDASADTLYERAAAPSRPLTALGRDAFAELARARKPYYESLAQARIDVGAMNVEHIVEVAMRSWKGNDDGQ